MIDCSKTAVESRRRARRETLQAELDRMMALLRGHEGVRRVVLFGSLAEGNAGSRSDLDIAIVQDTDKRFLDRLKEIYDLLKPRVEADVLVYTPAEWEDLRVSRAFIRRIAERGVVLYERAPEPAARA